MEKSYAMKTRLFTSVLIILSVSLFAQTSLTYQKNALIVSDSNAYKEFQFSGPGNAGPNQVWDYSKIQYTGKSPVSLLQSAPAHKMTGVGDYNLSLIENGYDYFMNSSENKLEELGYVNQELKLTLKYSDPVIKMKYPFSYGQQFSDHFIGVAYFNETNTIDFFGDCLVTADAFGTLILPDRIIEGALRVKSIKKGLQINMCGTTDVNIVKYNWYASGYRYPVLNLNIVENSVNGGAPVITRTAFANTQQLNQRSAILGSDNPAKLDNPANPIAKTDVAVAVSPNPFTDHLTYNYLLTEPLNVSVELYDLAGKYSGWLVKNQLQTEGLHTGEIDAETYHLNPGVYFLRFTFDKQLVVCKIVKI